MGEFVKVASVSEIAPGQSRLVNIPGQSRLVNIKGKAVALFNIEGSFFALDNACTHEEGPLAEGEIEGHEVTCPWHGARFDIRTGQVLCAPAYGDEDLWTGYFAVSTCLASNALHIIRGGPVWKAVRATSSIPGLLPPVYYDDGRMLVDGALLDNVPVRSMRTLKCGPNVVVNFDAEAVKSDVVDYAALEIDFFETKPR